MKVLSEQKSIIDDSITITSCHSAFREVQALHDWLLHQLNHDSELTPKDILVMCPQIEDYAPYVNAVFTRGWQDISDDVPPLPCSIADRSAKDSDPIVGAFVDMLSFPDSRFHVSSVIGLLRVPSIANKFGLNHDDIARVSQWLEQASVHWGLSQAHKQSVLNANASGAFTWQQGLSRLIKGFAYSDTETLYQNSLTIPSVEGLDGQLLGQLMLFIEQLQLMAAELAKTRTATAWQIYLTDVIENVFNFDNEQSETVLLNAIANLTEFTSEANYQTEISLAVVKEFLTHHFSIPDPGRQFMVGQVTFCSMLPMRSIPFKIIAVLGLNDGQYPRQRQPLAFDLMSMTPAKLGDRSRRGDDRYLFLEAIISARQSLYLSYQGRNVSNNKKKEPSIVLQEFMDYLEHGYGWQCHDGEGDSIRQMPLQPFAVKNYQGKWAGFDANWLNLSGHDLAVGDQDQNGKVLDTNVAKPVVKPKNDQLAENNAEIEISLEQLIRFYVHPSRWYAQKMLNLTFEETEARLADAETFTYDRLASYQLKQDMLASMLEVDASEEILEKDLILIKAHAKLTGHFADAPITEQLFDKWQQDSEIFAQAIKNNGYSKHELIHLVHSCQLPSGQMVKVTGALPVAINDNTGQHSIFTYRSSTAKAKDIFSLYCYQLLAQVAQFNSAVDNQELTVNSLPDIKHSLGCYFDTKSQKVSQLGFNEITNAESKLNDLIEQFLVGQETPLLLNADIAHKYFTARSFEQPQFEKFWFDANAFNPPARDPYIQYFWPDCPEFSALAPALESIYQGMYQAMHKVKG